MSHPLVHPETPRVAVTSGCTLGEGPVWDHRTGTLHFVDIKGNPGIWSYQPETGHARKLDVAEPVGFVALTQDTDIVIAGFKPGLVRLHLFDGAAQPLASPDPHPAHHRLNDGHVSAKGHVLFGTMQDAEEEPEGRFWLYDGESMRAFGEPHVVTNGPAISPDGQTLYTVDSVGGMVHAHDLDGTEVGEARRFIRFEEGWGSPDGLAVDAEGYLWICHWGGSRVSRFGPDGAIERTVPVPTAQVTKCAFGGPDMTTLFITTAGIGRDPVIDPMAGHVFAVETGIRGQKAHLARV